MRNLTLAVLCTLCCLGTAGPGGGPAGLVSVRSAQAAGTAPGFELVYTAPVETTLSRPGLRSPTKVWPELFDQARRTLDIAEFYVANQAGEPLEPILAHLSRAGARGVKIRFLIERRMLAASEESLATLRRIPNLELRVIDWGRVRGDGEGIHHAKYMVADSATGYVGSQNFDWRSLKHVQELGLLLREPGVVSGMAAIFERDWQAQGRLDRGEAVAQQPAEAAASRQAADPQRRAYLVASPYAQNPPGVADSETELQRLIGAARGEVCAQVMNYSPLSHNGKAYYAPIDTALRAAAARGVKVRLLVSHWNTDHPGIDYLKSLSLVPGVSIKLVTIPEAKAGFIPYARVIHAKYMVVDGKLLWLGTSNWTGGYLDNSRNLEVVVGEPALATEARALHEQVWNSPYAEALDVTRDYPRARRH